MSEQNIEAHTLLLVHGVVISLSLLHLFLFVASTLPLLIRRHSGIRHCRLEPNDDECCYYCCCCHCAGLSPTDGGCSAVVLVSLPTALETMIVFFSSGSPLSCWFRCSHFCGLRKTDDERTAPCVFISALARLLRSDWWSSWLSQTPPLLQISARCRCTD